MYIGYNMNFIKKLFGVKENSATAYSPTYTIGWSVYTKDGTILSRQYEAVSFEQRTEIVELIKKETEDMQNILNKAIKEEIEFVNLHGNVLRLSDITKVGFTSFTQKSK
jgi:hypothetical protein